MGDVLSASFDSPLGLMTIKASDGDIVRVKWGAPAPRMNSEASELVEAMHQLKAYFAGQLTMFDLPLRVEGTDFQRDVCRAMSNIPFGETRTYGDLARDIGVSAQAIGNACGANPIPVIIPCHRVLGASSLGGFSGSGGIESKVWLLRHEGAAGLLI